MERALAWGEEGGAQAHHPPSTSAPPSLPPGSLRKRRVKPSLEHGKCFLATYWGGGEMYKGVSGEKKAALMKGQYSP